MTRRHTTPRFEITYRIGERTYQTTIPAMSAAHARRQWDRPGATLLRVEEVDANGLPVN